MPLYLCWLTSGGLHNHDSVGIAGIQIAKKTLLQQTECCCKQWLDCLTILNVHVKTLNKE